LLYFRRRRHVLLRLRDFFIDVFAPLYAVIIYAAAFASAMFIICHMLLLHDERHLMARHIDAIADCAIIIIAVDTLIYATRCADEQRDEILYEAEPLFFHAIIDAAIIAAVIITLTLLRR